MNATAAQQILELIDPEVRLDLVEARRTAMGGSLSSAVSLLDAKAASLGVSGKVLETVAVANLKAELLFLDRQERRAVVVFEELIDPLYDKLPLVVQFVLDQNRSDLRFALWDPESTKRFYHLIDRQEMAGFELHDTFQLVVAEEEASEDKHYMALAGFWREAVRTFRQGCWRSHRLAAKRLARECLRIGLPHEAAFHAVSAQDDALAGQVGDALLASREIDWIRSTLATIQRAANLDRHFTVACETVTRIADAVPDDQVETVARWLLARCVLPSAGLGTGGALDRAWKALESIAWRLSPALAREAVEAAVGHVCWTHNPSRPNAVIIEREQMVKAATRLAHVVPPEELAALARASIPLATERRQDHDFADVVNLLCHIADRAGDPVRSMIGDQLFPAGQAVTYLVGQTAERFGKQFLPPDRLTRAADEVARNIRLQVQRVPLDREAEPVPGCLLAFTNASGSVKVVITATQGVELYTMAKHRGAIAAEARVRLIEAALSMIVERENFLANRIGLIRGLMEMGDCFSDDQAESVCSALMPLARGEIQEASLHPTAAESANPLNPNKIRIGCPCELRGTALFALARIAHCRPDSYGRKLEPILEDGLSALDAEVRSSAFAAAHELPKLSEASLMAVLLGTRDGDPNAASAAFRALATKRDMHLTRSQWQLFLYSSRMASQASSAKLRRAAASALSNLLGNAPTEATKARAAELIELFIRDVCASVRVAVNQPH